MMPARGVLITRVIPGLVALLAALALALAGGAVWRRSNGRLRTTRTEGGPLVPRQQRLTSEQLGHALGERATLLQFSSAFCAPCRTTRRILTDIAAMMPGVAHLDIDAESHLDLVRELNVLRTPTVLVLGADGCIVSRGSGQPRKPDVIAALGLAVGESIPTYKIGNQASDTTSQSA